MKIERVIAINFGALRQDDYEFGQANLIVGKNGAGKSTLQDLIQIVLAGNDHNLIRLNPAQDVEQRKHRRRVTKRSLAAYAVNMTDDGPGRPHGAIVVIGLVFQPDPDEKAEPMTALWFADVVPDQTAGERKPTFRVREEFGALVRHALRASDFLVREGANHWRIPSLEDLSDALLARHSRGQVLCPLAKRAYVTRLHEWLSGGALATKHEAERATRAFIQSISLKDISDVDSIVRERVLDDMDLSTDIQETAATLRELDALQQESERLRLLEDELIHANRYGQDILRAIRDGHVQHAADSLQQRDRFKQQCQQSVTTLADIDLELHAKQHQLEQLRQQIEVAEGRYQFESRRASNHATLQDQSDLLHRIEAGANARTQAVAEILASLQQEHALTQLHRVFGAISIERFPGLGDAVGPVAFQISELQRARDGLLTLVRQLASDSPDATAFETLEALALQHDVHVSLLSGDGSAGLVRVRDAALDALTATSVELSRTREQHADLKQQLADSERGAARVPGAVKEALVFLQRKLPAARPRLLCDVVRPRTGTVWQGAIEGLLGGARFTIIVEPDHESAAHLLLREWTDVHARGLRDTDVAALAAGPTLVQSRRARADVRQYPPSARSIVHELEFDDELGRDFVTARYGSTVKVTDAAELETTASGLMADGRLSKSYSRRVAKYPAKLWVFGLEARRAQRQVLTEEVAASQERLRVLEADVRALETAAKVAVDGASLLLRSTIAQLRRYEVELNELHRRQASLLQNDPDAAAIVQRLAMLHQELQDLRTQMSSVEAQWGALGHKRTTAAGQLAKHQSQQADAEQELQRRYGLLETVRSVLEPDSAPGEWIRAVEQFVATAMTGADALVLAAGTVAQRFQAIQGHLDRYLDRAREGEGVERIPNIDLGDVWPHLQDIVRTVRSVEKRLRALQGSSLRENAEKIHETKHRFASVLTDTLVQKMLSKTKEIQFVIDTLNRPLSNLDFGTHRTYQIIHTPKPEFAEYLKFFSAVRDKAQDLSPADQWFGTDIFTAEEQAVRERIKRNLLNASSEEGRRELERIGNAANYYEYDLKFQTEAGTKVLYSEWGTGSGGENATPPYILCGMLVANACGWFRGRGPRLRLLMLDEAFKVHDLERSNRVIEYLQRMGFQLIVAAQMEKATSILPNFTTTMSVARLAASVGGRRTWISQIHTIGLNRDPLRALWEARRREVAEQAELEFRREFPQSPTAEIQA